MHINVIKVGGAIVENPASLAQLLDEFVKLQGPKILVHGGGRTATTIASQLGIESRMVGGRRITDAEMLRVVTMVYAGLVNKNIVAQLQARGVNAIGLTGADMNIVRAHRRPITPEGIDFGFVGDVDSADGQPLRALLDQGITPVIAPLTHDGQGNLLNINADTMAQTIAVAMSRPTPLPLPVREGSSHHLTAEEGETSAPDPQRTLTTEDTIDPQKVYTPLPTREGQGGGSVGSRSAHVSLTYCFELPGVMRDPSDPASLIPHINPDLFRQLIADGTVSGGMIPKLENAFAAIRAGVAQVRITAHTALQSGTIITP